MNHNKFESNGNDKQESKYSVSKRVMLGLTTAALALGLMTGCGDTDANAKPNESTEPTTEEVVESSTSSSEVEFVDDENSKYNGMEKELVKYLEAEDKKAEEYTNREWIEENPEAKELAEMSYGEFAEQPYEKQVKYAATLYNEYVEYISSLKTSDGEDREEITDDAGNTDHINKPTLSIDKYSSAKQYTEYLINVHRFATNIGRYYDDPAIGEKALSLIYNPTNTTNKSAMSKYDSNRSYVQTFEDNEGSLSVEEYYDLDTVKLLDKNDETVRLNLTKSETYSKVINGTYNLNPNATETYRYFEVTDYNGTKTISMYQTE